MTHLSVICLHARTFRQTLSFLDWFRRLLLIEIHISHLHFSQTHHFHLIHQKDYQLIFSESISHFSSFIQPSSSYFTYISASPVHIPQLFAFDILSRRHGRRPPRPLPALPSHYLIWHIDTFHYFIDISHCILHYAFASFSLFFDTVFTSLYFLHWI